MRDYNVSGISDKHVQVTPPIRQGERISSWVQAGSQKGAVREFRSKMKRCYGISVTDIRVYD